MYGLYNNAWEKIVNFLIVSLANLTIVNDYSHEDEDCCNKGKTDECFPIPVPKDDNFYGLRNVTCLEFRRSVIFCGEQEGSKEQFNEVSHFIDASTVYGSEEEIANDLRTFVDGELG